MTNVVQLGKEVINADQIRQQLEERIVELVHKEFGSYELFHKTDFMVIATAVMHNSVPIQQLIEDKIIELLKGIEEWRLNEVVGQALAERITLTLGK